MARTQNILRYIVFLYLFIPSLIYAIPRVINVTSIDGYYKPGDTIPIYVTFNESIELCPPLDAYILLNSGGNATLSSKENFTIALFTYVVQPGHNSNDLSYTISFIQDPNTSDIRGEGSACNGYSAYEEVLPTPGQPGSLNYNNNVVVDTIAPSGGSISYTDGYYNTTSVPITFDVGSDSGSGLNLSSGQIQRAEATLSNGACGSFGAFTTIAYDSDGSYTDTTVESNKCYKYQYLIYDNAGNSVTYQTSNIAQIFQIFSLVWLSPKEGENIFFKQSLNISWIEQIAGNNYPCTHNVSIMHMDSGTSISIANDTNDTSIIWPIQKDLQYGWYNLSVVSVCPYNTSTSSILIRKVESFLPMKTNQNKTYIESFISQPFKYILGNDDTASAISAILLVGFFLSFVSFQNIRIEGKAVVIIPALLLATTFIGWLYTLVALGVGILFYLALGRLFNK